MIKNKIFYVILLAIVISSCNRPVSRFTIKEEDNQAAPAEFNFVNESKNTDFYLWNFGDGDSSFHENPTHIFYKPGTYEITLQSIRDKKSRLHKKTITVTAPKSTLIEIQTPYGEMIAELYDDTPQHRDNFIKLVSEGFYNDLLFHRVIDGFMIQGGDPDSKNASPDKRLGAGGPGYQIPAEIEAGHAHIKGALAAARQGDAVNPEKKSSGSQFYIVHGGPVSRKDLEMFSQRSGRNFAEETIEEYLKSGGTPFLDGQYTVFGRVIKGLEVIDQIAKSQTRSDDRPIEDIKMKIVEIKKKWKKKKVFWVLTSVVRASNWGSRILPLVNFYQNDINF